MLWFYMLGTAVLAAFCWAFGHFEVSFLKEILSVRLWFVLCYALAMLLWWKLKTSAKNKIALNFLLAYAFLGLIYKDTAVLNQLFFDKIDPFLMQADVLMWGFQPALKFSEVMNATWFSELMFFSYFFYYLMPLVVLFTLYQRAPQVIAEFGTMLITAFVIYYSIFIVLPAVGPQFYFPDPENTIPQRGLFSFLVKQIQAMGEAPTAAFPSSHVGVSVVVLLWLYPRYKRLFYGILPLSILLFFSTVYIKAHYAIDVLAGLVSGACIYVFIALFYNHFKNKNYEI
ncbi:phosphatase PAP2 family protein [Riemerella columbina]|uniref:phosphatase PAP2 family protein n=1 Tax=Riemerella columbina TaxID=103810 RepID=UPI0026700FA4|nr:phosphatase PAP2 family protein [Riemerella columbina]WKS95486.1 phosphatase PAP2 family protein [Riemerella columbina]